MTNLERDELVASLRDWFKGRGLTGGEAIGIMVLAIAAVTRKFDDPEVLVDATIRGLRRVAADTTPEPLTGSSRRASTAPMPSPRRVDQKSLIATPQYTGKPLTGSSRRASTAR